MVVLLSSDLMNGDEVYASSMMLLMPPVSANSLRKRSSWLTMRLAIHYQFNGWLLVEILLLA
jgi:hypothetical protein